MEKQVLVTLSEEHLAEVRSITDEQAAIQETIDGLIKRRAVLGRGLKDFWDKVIALYGLEDDGKYTANLGTGEVFERKDR